MENVNHIEPVTTTLAIAGLLGGIFGKSEAKKQQENAIKYTNSLNSLTSRLNDKNEAANYYATMQNENIKIKKSEKISSIAMFITLGILAIVLFFLIKKIL